MSRSRHWEYLQTWHAGADRDLVMASWERFFDRCPLPVKYVPTGGCNSDEATVVLYANRSKARRLAAYLDGFFGRPGTMSALGDSW